MKRNFKEMKLTPAASPLLTLTIAKRALFLAKNEGEWKGVERSGKEWKGIEIKGKRSKEMERNSKKVQRTLKRKWKQIEKWNRQETEMEKCPRPARAKWHER